MSTGLYHLKLSVRLWSLKPSDPNYNRVRGKLLIKVNGIQTTVWESNEEQNITKPFYAYPDWLNTSIKDTDKVEVKADLRIMGGNMRWHTSWAEIDKQLSSGGRQYLELSLFEHKIKANFMFIWEEDKLYHLNVKLVSVTEPSTGTSYQTHGQLPPPDENLHATGWFGFRVNGMETTICAADSWNLYNWVGEGGTAETGWLNILVKATDKIEVGGHLIRAHKGEVWDKWTVVDRLTHDRSEPTAHLLDYKEVIVSMNDKNKVVATFQLNWEEKTSESAKVMLKSIRCVNEDDSGSTEEIYGTFVAYKTPKITDTPLESDENLWESPVTLWSRTEDNPEEMGTGQELTYSDYKNIRNSNLKNQTIVVRGHLFEDDVGHDDDFGTQYFWFDSLYAADQIRTWRHDDSVFTATVGVSDHTRRLMFNLKYVKCIKPSTGANAATNTLMHGIAVFEDLLTVAGAVATGGSYLAAKVALKTNSIVKVGLKVMRGVKIANKVVSITGKVVDVAVVRATGSDSSILADFFSFRRYEKMYEENWAGTDDLKVSVNGEKVFPHGEGSYDIHQGVRVPVNHKMEIPNVNPTILAQQHKLIDIMKKEGKDLSSLPRLFEAKVRLWEADSVSEDDVLADFVIDGAELLTLSEDTPVVHGIDEFTSPVEGSSYEIGWSVGWE